MKQMGHYIALLNVCSASMKNMWIHECKSLNCFIGCMSVRPVSTIMKILKYVNISNWIVFVVDILDDISDILRFSGKK